MILQLVQNDLATSWSVILTFIFTHNPANLGGGGDPLQTRHCAVKMFPVATGAIFQMLKVKDYDYKKMFEGGARPPKSSRLPDSGLELSAGSRMQRCGARN